MTPAPAGLTRHFDGAPPDLTDSAARSALVGRLLEDGDRADLAWLGGQVPRSELVAWFRAHGGRRLSRRSRAFWSATFGEPLPAASPLAEAFWPLA